MTDNFVLNFTVDENIHESITSDFFSLVFDNTILSVNENTFGVSFSVFPNPNKDGQVSIKVLNLNGEVHVEVSTLTGKIVYQNKRNLEENQVNLKVERLLSGAYLVELLQEDDQTFSSTNLLRAEIIAKSPFHC